MLLGLIGRTVAGAHLLARVAEAAPVVVPAGLDLRLCGVQAGRDDPDDLSTFSDPPLCLYDGKFLRIDLLAAAGGAAAAAGAGAGGCRCGRGGRLSGGEAGGGEDEGGGVTHSCCWCCWG